MGGLFIAVVVVFPARARRADDRPDHPAGSWKASDRERARPRPSRARRRRRPNRGERSRCPPAPISCSRSKASRVSFDGFKAVDDLNLYIDYGELRVIIGPNGAGKTTVLDLICGRTRVSGGSIKFKDQEITGCKEQEIVRRGIGRKFQTPTIYEDLTVSRISNCRCRAAATSSARCSGSAPTR